MNICERICKTICIFKYQYITNINKIRSVDKDKPTIPSYIYLIANNFNSTIEIAYFSYLANSFIQK